MVQRLQAGHQRPTAQFTGDLTAQDLEPTDIDGLVGWFPLAYPTTDPETKP